MNFIMTDSEKKNFGVCLDKSISIIGIIIPFGYTSENIEPGYAHLFEHMIIKSGQKYFDHLESKGINYNAETQENQILFTFIDFNKNILVNEKENIKNILNVNFTLDDLEAEKKMIQQEYIYLQSRFDNALLDKSLGSINQISKFDLSKLNYYKKHVFNTFITLYMDKVPENLMNSTETISNLYIDDNWYNKIRIESATYNENSIQLKISNNIYSKLFIYNLRVLCNYSYNPVKIDVYNKNNNYYIQVNDSITNFINKIQNKEKAYKRYILLMDTIKICYQEIAYQIAEIRENYDISKCYFSNWEAIFFDKFIK